MEHSGLVGYGLYGWTQAGRMAGKEMLKNVGIDIGSTTVKVVVMQGEQILYRIYRRHMSQVRQATLQALEGARGFLQGESFRVAISGSAGLGLAEDAGIDFVQEVFATHKAVMEYEPDTDAVIELGGEDAKIIFLTGGAAVSQSSRRAANRKSSSVSRAAAGR